MRKITNIPIPWEKNISPKVYKDCICIKAKEKAILVMRKKDKLKSWIPRSVIHDPSEIKNINDEGILIINNGFVQCLVWATTPRIPKTPVWKEADKHYYNDTLADINTNKDWYR